MLESTHPSQMPFSPTSAPPQSHFSLGGFAVAGSTGKSFSRAGQTFPHFSQYQNGIGTPKVLWREKHQSHSNPSVQSSNNCNAKEGYHSLSRAALRIFSLFSLILMNHCVESTSSTGFLHLSCIFTTCESFSCFSKSPPRFKSSKICSRALLKCSPEYFPAFKSSPFSSIALITGSECCFCHKTSC